MSPRGKHSLLTAVLKVIVHKAICWKMKFREYDSTISTYMKTTYSFMIQW